MADAATRSPVTPDTIFNLASVSKQFTAFSLLLLVQEGKISLSDSVLSVLPELGEYARPVTLRHLLHHTGGLKDYMDLAFARKTGFYDPLTPQETLADLISQTEADFPPGTRHDYSNTGYFLLSQVIERVSGQSLADFARERIFAPLEMNHTFIVVQYPAPQTIATGYGKAAGQWRISESPWTHTGDGAVHSSAADLMKWGENYRTACAGGTSLIQQMAETLSPLTESGTPVTDYEPYAAGLHTLHHFGELSLEHAGGWMGTSTYFIRLTESDTTIVALSNREECDTEALARSAVAAFLRPAFPAAITDHWDEEYRRGDVLTDPRYRRQGFARRALLALNHSILNAGLKPQYRCQTDNLSSLILAQQSGFTPFAQWDFLLSEDGEE